MKNKKITSYAVGVLLIFGLTYCTPKQTAKQPSTVVAASATDVGRDIMNSSCGSCHELHQPGTRNMAQWDRVLKVMIPKAKLTEEEGKLVRNYIMMNALDAKK